MSKSAFQALLLGPFPPPHGGVQTNLVAIRDYLRGQGIPCSVINLTRFRQADSDGVYYPHGALATLRLLLRLPRTIIHLHIGGDPAPRLLLLGILCSYLPGSKTVLTFHSGGYPESPAGLVAHPKSFVAYAFRRFDRLIGVNTALIRLFVEQFGVSREKTRHILPFALAERVPDVAFPPALDAFFEAYSPVMISMGWLEPEYDFPLQIRALGPVRQKHPRAGLVILGEGRLGPELRAQIADSGWADHVLMPGDVAHDLSLAAIARADIFLRTTLYDGDSISVREALHFGTPVIASDNGMRPAGTRLIPKENLEALVDAICAQASERKPPARAGRLDQENIRAVFELYQELLAEKGNS